MVTLSYSGVVTTQLLVNRVPGKPYIPEICALSPSLVWDGAGQRFKGSGLRLRGLVRETRLLFSGHAQGDQKQTCRTQSCQSRTLSRKAVTKKVLKLKRLFPENALAYTGIDIAMLRSKGHTILPLEP